MPPRRAAMLKSLQAPETGDAAPLSGNISMLVDQNLLSIANASSRPNSDDIEG